MQVLRLHDPGRRPANWTDIVRPHQFAAFSRNLETGVPCDADGQSFADPAAATCVVFDDMEEARAFCEAAAARSSSVRFDVFDAKGRANPPLLTIVHPSRAGGLDTHPRALKRRRVVAYVLIGAGVPLLGVAYALKDIGHAIGPGIIGVNLILAGLRLLWFNLGVRETERDRESRLADASKDRGR